MERDEELIRKILSEIMEDEEFAVIPPKDDLKKRGMDSLKCIELQIELEKKFNILVPDELLGIMSVQTIQKICDLVRKLQNEKEDDRYAEKDSTVSQSSL